MLSALRRHPFGVEAFFRRSLVLTYAYPADVLTPLLGPGLTLDTYDGFGFLAIALVETEHLRPIGFPAWLGRSFFLSGYRIFTKFVRPGKQTLRGLRILRSDTDRRAMVTLGNRFTHYHYKLAAVACEASDSAYQVRIRTNDREADLHVVADLSLRPAPLPEGSVFASMDDALTFAGPLPYTFDFEAETGKMIVVRGLRRAWSPAPIQVDVKEASFLESKPFAGSAPRLANAFYLENVPYSWKPGTVEDIP